MTPKIEAKRWWQRERRCAQCGIRIAGIRRVFEGDSFCSDRCLDDDAGSRAW